MKEEWFQELNKEFQDETVERTEEVEMAELEREAKNTTVSGAKVDTRQVTREQSGETATKPARLGLVYGSG